LLPPDGMAITTTVGRRCRFKEGEGKGVDSGSKAKVGAEQLWSLMHRKDGDPESSTRTSLLVNDEGIESAGAWSHGRRQHGSKSGIPPILSSKASSLLDSRARSNPSDCKIRPSLSRDSWSKNHNCDSLVDTSRQFNRRPSSVSSSGSTTRGGPADSGQQGQRGRFIGERVKFGLCKPGSIPGAKGGLWWARRIGHTSGSRPSAVVQPPRQGDQSVFWAIQMQRLRLRANRPGPT
jgi:hypothetical protein